MLFKTIICEIKQQLHHNKIQTKSLKRKKTIEQDFDLGNNGAFSIDGKNNGGKYRKRSSE